MANHKSAAKRARQTIKRTSASKMKKSETRTAIKKLRQAIEDKDKNKVNELFTHSQSLLSRLSKRSGFHKRTGSRLISRLAAQVSQTLNS